MSELDYTQYIVYTDFTKHSHRGEGFWGIKADYLKLGIQSAVKPSMLYYLIIYDDTHTVKSHTRYTFFIR